MASREAETWHSQEKGRHEAVASKPGTQAPSGASGDVSAQGATQHAFCFDFPSAWKCSL